MANEVAKIMTAELYRVDKVETLNSLYGHITESATEAIGITEAAKVELAAATQAAMGAVSLVNIITQDNVELTVNAFARDPRTGTWVNSITVGGTVYTYKDDQGTETGKPYQWVNNTTIMLTEVRHPVAGTDSAYAATDPSTAIAIDSVSAYYYGTDERDTPAPAIRKVYGVSNDCPGSQTDEGGNRYFIAQDNIMYLGGESVTV